MKAVLLHRTGPPSVLRLVKVPDPVPGPGQVLVEVEAIGVNFAEVLSRKGLYGWAPKRPYVLGMEAAGHIRAVGSGVSEARLGEAVLVGAQFGAYAEYIAVDESRALPAVPGFSMEENAGFGVNFLTAWVGLVSLGRMRAEDRVAISAAAGGVGSAALHIARASGCWTLALAGSNRKLALAEEMGADAVARYGDARFPSRLAAAAGPDGIDLALETVGGEVFDAVQSTLAPFGRVVVAGYASLDYSRLNPLSWWRAWKGIPRIPIGDMSRGSKGLMATHLGYLLDRPEVLRAEWDALVAFAVEHDLRPWITRTLPLADVAEAHRALESRETTGKIVLLP